MPDHDTKAFLDSAYRLDGGDTTKEFYKDWAATYEAEVLGAGYASPARCAAALRPFARADDPILDLGCGTGLSGQALRSAGFATIDGTDFSEEMLALARAKPGLYRALIAGDLSRPIPAGPGEYRHFAAVGVFSPGHAPAEMIDAILALLVAGGCFVFSLNDHALADASYTDRIDGRVGDGLADIVFREHGPHLPRAGLRSTVYVLRRTALTAPSTAARSE